MSAGLSVSSVGFGLSFAFYSFMLLYYLVYKILWLPSEISMEFEGGKALRIKNVVDYNVLWVLLFKSSIYFCGFLMVLDSKSSGGAFRDQMDFVCSHLALVLYKHILLTYRYQWRQFIATIILFAAVMSALYCVVRVKLVIMLASMVLEICRELVGLFVKTRMPFGSSLKYVTDKQPILKFLEDPFNECGFDTSNVFCTSMHRFGAYK